MWGKKLFTVGGCFLLVVLWNGPEGGKVGEKGSGKLVMKKIRVWLNKKEGQIIGKNWYFGSNLEQYKGISGL